MNEGATSMLTFFGIQMDPECRNERKRCPLAFTLEILGKSTGQIGLLLVCYTYICRWIWAVVFT